MIPLLSDGILPDGVHECTIDEVEEAFGRFQRSDRRIQLTRQLRVFVEEARRSGIVAAVVIDGSYVTAKEEPEDIDLVIALRQDFDLGQQLPPFQYNLRSRRMVKQLYRFDAFAFPEGSDQFTNMVRFFSRIKSIEADAQTSRKAKGLLRITL